MYSENQLTATLPCAVNSISKINLPFQSYDLKWLISILKNDPNWGDGEMNSMIILKNISQSIVLAVVHEKTEISYASVKTPVTFRVIGGRLKIHSYKKEDRTLSSGETITMNDSKFRINSVKETVFLVILNT